MELKFVILAGEASGDLLGADLIVELRRQYPTAKFFGMAGPLMLAQNCQAWYHISELSLTGFVEILMHIFRLLKLRKSITQRIIDFRPDCVISIDSPDFFLPMDEKLKQNKIRVFHYVCPTVWAWKPKRALTLPKQVNGVFSIFPMEKKYFSDSKLNFEYVGHPLAKKVPLAISNKKSKKEVKTLAILPGSRGNEIRLLMPVIAQLVMHVNTKYKRMKIKIVAYNNSLAAKITDYLGKLDYEISIGNADQVLSIADLALVMSGTATLQAALHKTPMIILGKASHLTYFIVKLKLQTKYFGLPNIILNKPVVPEIIQYALTFRNCRKCLDELVENNNLRKQQIEDFKQLHSMLLVDEKKILGKTVKKWLSQS